MDDEFIFRYYRQAGRQAGIQQRKQKKAGLRPISSVSMSWSFVLVKASRKFFLPPLPLLLFPC
jgi:hypothetical protein